MMQYIKVYTYTSSYNWLLTRMIFSFQTFEAHKIWIKLRRNDKSWPSTRWTDGKKEKDINFLESMVEF